jgi:hypothetical protein
MTDAANAPPDAEAVTERTGVAGWLRGLVARAREADVRHAVAVTAVVVIAVVLLGRVPLGGDVELDLRAGDAVGGWTQLTLVGFSVNRPFGRFVPDQPGRRDLRIVSNRPLPERFELELVAWTLRPGHPVLLEATVGTETRTRRFGADATRARLAFANPTGARTIALALGDDDKLAVEHLAIRATQGTGARGERP